MSVVPLPPVLRPGGAADTKNVSLERFLEKVPAQQSQLHLRPYQVDVTGEIAARRAAGRHAIIRVAQKASGKRVIAAAIITGAEVRSGRSLFVARRELVDHSVKNLRGRHRCRRHPGRRAVDAAAPTEPA